MVQCSLVFVIFCRAHHLFYFSILKVYTSLDYESRFFGKEIVTLVANRFGKSGTAIVLALVSMNIDSSYFDTKTAPFALVILTLGWLLASNNIVNLLSFTNTKSSSCATGEGK